MKYFTETITYKMHDEIEKTRDELEVSFDNYEQGKEFCGHPLGLKPEIITDKQAEKEAANFDEFKTAHPNGLETPIGITPALLKDIWNGVVRWRQNWGCCEDECNRLIEMLNDGDTLEINGKSWFRTHIVDGTKYFIDTAGHEVVPDVIKLIVYQLTNAYIEITMNGKNIIELIDY